MKSFRNASIEPLEDRIAPATIYGVTAANDLIYFDSDAESGSTVLGAITGLQPGERIAAIDFRPSTGQLYGLGVTLNAISGMPDVGRIYSFHDSAASSSGNTFLLTSNGQYGFDFSPVGDFMRLIDDDGYNRRISTSGIVTNDVDLVERPLVAAAYDQNTYDTTTTTLFAIDNVENKLVRIGGVNGSPSSPNSGVSTDIGPLGITLTGPISFDIEGRSGLAFITNLSGGASVLSSVNLVTGAATFLRRAGAPGDLMTAIAVAPTIDLEIVNAKTATYLDIDGDLVTIKTSVGSFQPGDFGLIVGKTGSRLNSFDISSAHRGNAFSKTNLTFTAKPKLGMGDSFVNVGYINAIGIDLGSVKIDGNLRDLFAGDANVSKTSPGLASLTVNSMGNASIEGWIGKVLVKTDLSGNFTAESGGSIVSLNVIGDLNGAGVRATGDILSAHIFGSVVGGVQYGAAYHKGAISAVGKIGKVVVGGSLIGSGVSGEYGGSIVAGIGGIGSVSIGGDLRVDIGSGIHASIISAGSIGTVFIGGSLRADVNGFGGASNAGASVISAGSIDSITIGGSLVANANSLQDGPAAEIVTGSRLGSVKIGGSFIGGADNTAHIHSSGSMGSVTIGGSLEGGTGLLSGSIDSFGTMGDVKIGGRVKGGSGTTAGTIFSETSIGTVTLGGSLIGGSGTNSGSIRAVSLSHLPSSIGLVKIGGDLIGSNFTGSGQVVASDYIAGVQVRGSVDGSYFGGIQITASSGNARGIGPITIGGELHSAIIVEDGGSIASINVVGSIQNGLIFASGKLGHVKIGGDLRDSTISATGGSGLTKAETLGIASLTVRGDITKSDVLSGYDFDGNAIRASQGIGAVKIGGDWKSSSIAASVVLGNAIVGDSDDTAVPHGLAFVSRIASITITGQATGLAGAPGDGLAAEEIGTLKIGRATIPLTPGAHNDLTPRLISSGGSVLVREV